MPLDLNPPKLHVRHTDVKQITVADIETLFDAYPRFEEMIRNNSLGNLQYGIMRDFLLDVSKMNHEPSRVTLIGHIKKRLEL